MNLLQVSIRLSIKHANLRFSWCGEGSHTIHECDGEGESGVWLRQEHRTQGIQLRQLHDKGRAATTLTQFVL